MMTKVAALLKCDISFQYAAGRLEHLKEEVVSLGKLEAELAEFFCEDPAAFKIDECFKSLASFCSKFKQVRNCTSCESLSLKFEI